MGLHNTKSGVAGSGPKPPKTGATRARPAIVTLQGLLLKRIVSYCLRPVGVWLCSGWMGDFNTALALVLVLKEIIVMQQ